MSMITPIPISSPIPIPSQTFVVRAIIEQAIREQHLDFRKIFHSLELDLIAIESQIGQGGCLDELFSGLANMSYADWQNIHTITTYKGRVHSIINQDYLKLKLALFPGEIDYNLCYRNQFAYKDSIKSSIIIDEFRQSEFTEQEQQIIKPILMNYHTYIGMDNANFFKILEKYKREINSMWWKIEDMIARIATRWGEHLTKIQSFPPVDLVLLTSDTRTAHQVVTASLQEHLQAQQFSVRVVNETTLLGEDLLYQAIGYHRNLARKQNNTQLYDQLYKRLAFFLPDHRMEELRKMIGTSGTVISLNTNAHAARLVADGKRVLYDVFDVGNIHEKLIWLAKQVHEFGLNNIFFLTHEGTAYTVDELGQKIPAEGPGFIRTRYPVDRPCDSGVQRAFIEHLSQNRKLSVFALGEYTRKALSLLQIFLASETLNANRDLLFLAEPNSERIAQEIHSFLQDTEIPFSESLTSHPMAHNFLILNTELKVRVLKRLNRDQMYALTGICDHFIITPGPAISHEALAWGAKGVVVYFDGSHPWESGNLALLLQHNAGFIYDTTPPERLETMFIKSAGKPLAIPYDESPEESSVIAKTHHGEKIPSTFFPSASTLLQQEKPFVNAVTAGIYRAIDRMQSAYFGYPMKARDRLIPFRFIDANMLRQEVSAFLFQFFGTVRTLQRSDLESIGLRNETIAIQQVREQLIAAENQLLDIQEGVPNFTQGAPSSRKPITLWSGFKSMDRAISDPNVISNFDIPLCNLLFIAWEEIFCDPSTLEQSALKTAIPAALDPDIRKISVSLQQITHDIYSHGLKASEIAHRFFGSALNEEEIELAESSGIFISKMFVSTFHQPDLQPVIYASNNKLNENQPTLAVNSILWDYELPLLRTLNPHEPRFLYVQDGHITQYPLSEFYIVRNKWHILDNRRTELQFRSTYSIGMPGWPEWLLWSSQSKRSLTRVSRFQTIFQHRQVLA